MSSSILYMKVRALGQIRFFLKDLRATYAGVSYDLIVDCIDLFDDIFGIVFSWEFLD